MVDWYFDEFDTYRVNGMSHGKVPLDRVRHFFRHEICKSEDLIPTLVEIVRACDLLFLKKVSEEKAKSNQANRGRKK